MAKLRVYELAKELGLTSRSLLQTLVEGGEHVRSASSTLEPPVVRRLRQELGRTIEERTPSTSPALPTGSSQPPKHKPPQPTATHTQESGWRAGPIAPPSNPDLLKNMDVLRKRFPRFQRHREALQRLGSQVVFAALCKEKGSEECGVALIRFSGAIEAAFGLTREVLVFYSPYRDYQVRTFQAARAVLQAMNRPVTPDLFFASAPDPRLRTKLDDWSRPDLLGIPLSGEMDDDPVAFISLIRDYIYSRDLFYETTPVRGANFFGRRAFLQSLRDDVRNQRVAGIFGLRKAGKTSVLLQLSETMQSDAFVPVLLDLEAFPSPPEDPTPSILTELRRRFREELKQRGLRTAELAALPDEPTILQMKNALQILLKKLDRDGVHFLLMLDEIEYLTPSERIDIAEGDMPQISQFLGSLRSLVQETGNFTFIVSGLTSAIIESGRLYGRPNPMFSWAKAHYLAPFARSEADELATSLGAKMGIEIQGGALEALYDASGGHAFLYRNLASSVIATMPVDVYRRIMTKSEVLRALVPWQNALVGNINEMLDHVRRYYPTEGVLLDILRESPADFAELVEGEPLACHHLLSLGLIRRDGSNFALNSVLELA